MRQTISVALIFFFAGSLAWPLIPSEECEMVCTPQSCCELEPMNEVCPMMVEAETHAPLLLLSAPKPSVVKDSYSPLVLLTAEDRTDPWNDFSFRRGEPTSSFRAHLKIPLYFQNHSLLI